MEKWIGGYENLYAVTDDGNVISYKGRRKELKPMMTGHVGNKFRTVGLCKGGKQTNKKVCHLVLETFVGPRPTSAHVCRHLNDDRMDERVENLCWGTQKQNVKDAKRNGRIGKLTAEDVTLVKQCLKEGYTCKEIAEVVGVSQWTIHDIKQGRTWKCM